MESALAVVIAIAVLVVIIAATSIRIMREYERGVVFRLGRLIGEKRPGIR